MEKAMQQTSLEKVSRCIDYHVGQIKDGAGEITSDALSCNRNQFLSDLRYRCVDAHKPYEPPKGIECRYRGVVSKVICTSPADQ